MGIADTGGPGVKEGDVCALSSRSVQRVVARSVNAGWITPASLHCALTTSACVSVRAARPVCVTFSDSL
eukprot:1287386-Rhodomonas_salina.2